MAADYPLDLTVRLWGFAALAGKASNLRMNRYRFYKLGSRFLRRQELLRDKKPVTLS